MKTITKLWALIIILAVITPLGFIIPEYFKSGAAWGEWDIDEIKNFIGYIPEGLSRLSSIWKAPMPDYAFKGWEEKGLLHLSFAYIISAIVGIGVIVILVIGISKIFVKKED